MALRLIIFFLGMSFLSSAHAKVAPLLRCLGQEELNIHLKKVEGPVYRLNQRMINLVAEANNVELAEGEYKKICGNRHFSPSVAMLRALLLRGTKVFRLDRSNLGTFAQQRSVVTKINDATPKIFFGYLSQLQGLTQDPKCLQKEIPELEYFILRFKYLEVNISAKTILSDKPKIVSIFEKIKNLNRIIKKCKS